MQSSCLPGLLALGALLPLHTGARAAPVPATSPLAGLTEVVVTARRIEEPLQSVAMSVQALSGEYLEETGTTRLLDLQFAVPGLVVSSTGLSGVGISLRGIAGQRVTRQSVAPHLNGVYLGNANLAIARLFDLERIEVLKGPQGSLYGRNATGGSINFITRPPQDSFSADIEGSYGSFDTSRAQGHLNMPFRDAAVRVAFITSEGDGYIRNAVDDRTFAEDDFWGLRASLRIHASENLSLDVMAQHVGDDGASGDLWGPRPDFLVDPRDIRLTTVTLANPYLISETDNLNVTLEYDLGIASLRSITGYANSEVRNLDDCSGTPPLLGCVRSALPNRFSQWSQELQLVFPRKGSVDGLAGVYYADADEVSRFSLFVPRANVRPLNDRRSTSDESAAAVFGQASWHFAERWSATGGVRLSTEKHRFSTIGTGVQDSPALRVAERDFDDFSWRLDVQHTVADDILLFAGVSTGFKSGGFVADNTGLPDSFDSENLVAYEAGGKTQWLDRRLTLNAAAFFYDFEDLQVSRSYFDLERGIFVSSVDNAASAELYGMDVESGLQVTDRLSVSAGVVWLPKREFVKYVDNTAGDTLTGNELVRAPEWTGIGAINYEHPLGDLGALSARLEYSYRSGHFFAPDNEPFHSQGEFGLLNLFLRFEAASARWYVFASGRNLTDEDYFNQVFIQSSPGYPDTYEIGAGYRF